MNLSSSTIDTLKNFAMINPNIVVKEGSTITTISEAKNILAKATIEEQVPVEHGIYDLNNFLNVVAMFDEPVLQYGDDGKSTRIADAKFKHSVTYFFSDKSILTSPQKMIQMPDPEVSFLLSQDHMNRLRKAATTLGVEDIVIESVGSTPCDHSSGGVVVKVTDLKDNTANSYEMELKGVQSSVESFRAIFNINNFKFISGEYQVDLSSKLISHFTNTTRDVEYWVALEKSSSFNR